MSPNSSVNVATVSKADPSEGRAAHPMTSVKVKGGPRLSGARSAPRPHKKVRHNAPLFSTIRFGLGS